MKYLKKFETETAYNTFKTSQDYITPNVSLVTDDNVVYYNPYVEPPHDYSQDYFTFEVLEAGTITFTCVPDQEDDYDYERYNVTIQYSLDNGSTWTSLTTTLEPQTLGGNLSVGDKVLVKGNNAVYGNDTVNANVFRGTAKTKVYGNIMSLIYGDNFKNQTTLPNYWGFAELFFMYTNLISAENLILPATLGDYSYMYMFYGCTSLTTAPELPATTLSYYCYYFMFYGCTSLNSITCLATNISAGDCTTNWVNGVASSGTFTKAASMTSWTTGSNGIPSGWTTQDASE